MRVRHSAGRLGRELGLRVWRDRARSARGFQARQRAGCENTASRTARPRATGSSDALTRKRADALLRAHRRRAGADGHPRRVPRLLLPMGSEARPAKWRAAHGFQAADRGRQDGVLRLRRHRRRLHLDPPLFEVVQVRLHADLRQPLTRDSERTNDAPAGPRDVAPQRR